MTKKEFQDLPLGVDEKGEICLYKEGKNGKTTKIRNISIEECAAIYSYLYTVYRSIHPDRKVMLLPYEAGKSLAITEVEDKKN